MMGSLEKPGSALRKNLTLSCRLRISTLTAPAKWASCLFRESLPRCEPLWLHLLRSSSLGFPLPYNGSQKTLPFLRDGGRGRGSAHSFFCART